MPITVDDLRRFTVARNFFNPTTLKRAVHKMGFVQADPIRAPARAQDLILRQRVKNYHAGELERRYETLDIEEDFFVTYGFVTRSIHALMHPRLIGASGRGEKGKRKTNRAKLLLDFVRERGGVHPREVDEHFSHGRVTNNWGGTSNATTHLLDAMHYGGLLRVARREKGIRIYAAREEEVPFQAGAFSSPPKVALIDQAGRDACAPKITDALIDVVVKVYAPLPSRSLAYFVRRLRYAAPQWQKELNSALARAIERLSHARVAGVDWYWPADERLTRRAPSESPSETVRLLAPFDPLVNDRARFELLWNWAYRFEAYTPIGKRKLGYYAMPLLWRDRVIGWANLSVKNGKLDAEFGYVGPQPRERVFKRELEAELDRMREFLGLVS